MAWVGIEGSTTIASIALAATLLGCADDAANNTGDATANTGSTASDDGSTAAGDEDALEYCPGVPEGSDLVCRTPDDCGPDEEFPQCGPAGAGGPCGGAGGCILDWLGGPECQSSAECTDIDGAGLQGVCRFGEDPCCGEVSACVATCTPQSCAADERCEPDGLCAPIVCNDGFACAEGSRCEPGVAGSDPHGCVVIPCDGEGALACPLLHECVEGTCQRIACERDSDCSCGNCLGSQCWETPWFCYTDPV